MGQAVIKEASADPNIVLFLDEIHTLMRTGKAGGAMDVEEPPPQEALEILRGLRTGTVFDVFGNHRAVER